ncbi:MAG: 16S rRNA (adenine(1518)-N(6)/adenine(1519)-N(6))-dimethyltransferase RsmA [Acidobacteriota bacterium]|nr:16S rRNA (adenine(1518)-N(6)/adenine(1519)-N(6))-dimethyltransferase RsmA [Acidobacteriota bacterium]
MPRKLGQHFLVRDTILERVAAACGEHVARAVEIGPGRGALTRHLLPRTDELHAVELDRSLAAYLRHKFATEAKLHIHQGDVLATDLAQWGPAVIAGNLPYYITSPVIEKFVNMDARFPLAVFLMQWEVAERLLANPGSRSYGYLTVAVRLICETEMIAKIPPSAFVPPPKVDSAALLFRRKAHAPENLPELLRFIGRCFTHKRKTLRNNLRPVYGPRIDAQPEARLRAEQLSIRQFIDLYERLTALYTEGS